MSNPAKNFVNRQKDVEKVEVHLTPQQIAILNQWSEKLGIPFKDAVMFAVDMGIKDTDPSYWNVV